MTTTKRIKNINVAPLNVALMQTFEPLLAKLDMNPNFFNDPSIEQQDKRVDTGLAVTLGMLAQTVYTQCYGPIVIRRAGQADTQIESAKERMDKSQANLQEHFDRYSQDREAMSTDPRTYTLAHWFEVNEIRFTSYKDLLDALTSVYHQVTGEEWKPRTANAQPTKKVNVGDTEKKRLEALMNKFAGKAA